MLHLEPWDKALLTGGDCNISHFQSLPWGIDEEISDGDVPRSIVMIRWTSHDAASDPHNLRLVPGLEHPPSPHIEIPYVPEPEYPEYLVPSEDEAPMEDQPLPADASTIALSPGYVPDSDPEEDSRAGAC
ncbi:hypothetical protein Tco_1555129 [Tanacetum coccineum]